MSSILAMPVLIAAAFASGGGGAQGLVNPLGTVSNGVLSSPSLSPGASLADGFPLATMTVGGTPPAGADVNGVLKYITGFQAWVNAGGEFQFNSTLAAAIGGYPLGAVLQLSTSPYGSVVNLVNGNSNNPNSNMTGWAPAGAAYPTGQVLYGSGAGTTSSANLTYGANGLAVSNTTASTSTTTGALVVSGGVGIAGAACLGGGVSVAGNGYIGGALTVAQTATLTASSGTAGLIVAPGNNTLPQIILYGSLSGAGGQYGRLYFTDTGNNTLDLRSNYALSAITLSPGGNVAVTITQASGLVMNGLGISATTGTFSGQVQYTATTASTSTTTGCATFSGGVGIASSLYVGGAIYTANNVVITGGSTNVPGSIYFNGTNGLCIQAKTGTASDLTLISNSYLTILSVTPGTVNVTLTGVTSHTSTAASTSITTGCATFSGGVGINGAVWTSGLFMSTYNSANANATYNGNWNGSNTWGLGAINTHGLRLGMTNASTGAWMTAPGDFTFQVDGAIYTTSGCIFNGTGQILALNNTAGGSSTTALAFNEIGATKYQIGTNLVIGSAGAFEIYDNVNSKNLAAFYAGTGNATLIGVVSHTNTTASTSTTTGCATFSGGVGVAGALYAGNIYTNGIQVVSVGGGASVLSANLSGSRTVGSSYTNSTGRVLVVYAVIAGIAANGGNAYALINDSIVGYYINSGATTSEFGFAILVPPGAIYSISGGGPPTVVSWFEY